MSPSFVSESLLHGCYMVVNLTDHLGVTLIDRAPTCLGVSLLLGIHFGAAWVQQVMLP